MEPAISPPDSDAHARRKLAKIDMPADLAGRSVLDIGCGDGFFSMEARRRGAQRVVGIDIDSDSVGAARARNSDAGVEFLIGDATGQLPAGPFDLILLLSAIEHFKSPREVLARIRDILTPGGLLILELGMHTTPFKTIGRALRGAEQRYYPTLDLLADVWLEGFAFRRVGRSVEKPDDPVPHFVIHCRRTRTNLMFIEGEGGIGKSMLARQLGNATRSVTLSTDALCSAVLNERSQIPDPERRYMQAVDEFSGISRAWENLKRDNEVCDYFAAALAAAIRQCQGADLVVVEGYAAAILRERVAALLGDEFNLWRSEKVAGGRARSRLEKVFGSRKG